MPSCTPQDLYTEWLGTAPEIADSDIADSQDFDVVIIGGGHSGTQCAKEAAKAGAKVACLEMQAEDTQFYYGEDIGTFNSQYVQDMGYGPYDVQDVVEQLKRTGGYRVNTLLEKKYVENSGAMVDDFIGLVQDKNPDLLTNMNIQQPSSDYWTDKTQPQDMGNFKTYVGTFCMRSQILDEVADGVGAYSNIGPSEIISRDNAIENGAQWFFEYTGVKIITDDSGAATGVIATDVDGAYHQFNAAKAVVIAAGAFQNNPGMMREFYNEARELQAKNGQLAYSGEQPDGGRDSGAGQIMGVWAGGRMDAGPCASLANVSGPGPFGFAPSLLLNGKGDRFCNEADFNAQGNYINRQPNGIISLIFDANYKDIVERGGTNHGGVDFGVQAYVDQWTEDMTKVVDAGADGYVVRHGCLTERANMDKTPMYGANDLETLAGYLGYEGDAVTEFVASVNHYNDLCAAGSDDDFGKKADFMLPIATAPFYGAVESSQQAGTAVTLNGLVTDENYNVIGNDDAPIKGLYAIGNCCGGRFCLTYPGILAGNSIGQAMTNGYVCGQIVAAL